MYIVLYLLGIFFFELLFFLFNKRSIVIAFIRFALGVILAFFLYQYYDLYAFKGMFLIIFSIDPNFIGITYGFGLDIITVGFLLLTNTIMLLVFIYILPEYSIRNYDVLLSFLLYFLYGVFTAIDVFWFYIFFEASLIPMYLLIGIFGSRNRKIRASNLLFFFTFSSSLLLLFGILYIYSTNNVVLMNSERFFHFTYIEQILLWPVFFLAFAFKLPLFPFHIWLPEAHVEAPTIGSVILAGILLKLGVYGFIRFNLAYFSLATTVYFPYISPLCILGIFYASLFAIGQTDMKRVIAYSSVAHMSLMILGLFTQRGIAIYSVVLQSLSHGYIASGLFFLIGILYSRYHSRSMHVYGGLVYTMPIFSFFFLFFTFSNIALPLTSNFAGEFYILLSIYKTYPIAACLAALGVIMGPTYSLWMLNKVSFGNIKTNFTTMFYDLKLKETFLLLFLSIFIIALGIYPSTLFRYLNSDIIFSIKSMLI